MLKDCGSTEYWRMTKQFCILYFTYTSLHEQTCYDLTTSTGTAVLENMTDKSLIYIGYYFPWIDINRIYWSFLPSFLSRQTGSSSNKTVELCFFIHVYQFNLFCTKIKYTSTCNLPSWNKPLDSCGLYSHCRNRYNLIYCLQLNWETS